MSGQTDYGKGCRYRPIDRKKYEKNYDTIFKKGYTYYSKRDRRLVTIPKAKEVK